MKIEFEYADLKALQKTYKKDKTSGLVARITRFTFEVGTVDDETLLALTAAGSVNITMETLGIE